MQVHYVRNGNLLATNTNMATTPRIGEKIEIQKEIFKVKEVIWHPTEFGVWIEVLL